MANEVRKIEAFPKKAIQNITALFRRPVGNHSLMDKKKACDYFRKAVNQGYNELIQYIEKSGACKDRNEALKPGV